MKRLDGPSPLGRDHLPSFSVLVVLSLIRHIRHKHSAALKMFSNRVIVVGAGVFGYTAGLGVPRMEVDFFGAEHIQPRFFPFQPQQDDLMRRDGRCGSDWHPCKCSSRVNETPSTRTGLLPNAQEPGSDVNSTVCCSNSDYCMIDESTLRAQCCALGSTCGSTCGENEYYSVITTTGMTSGTVTTGTTVACVGRPCTSTNYLCPASMGGKCCAFGQDCASSGLCLDYGIAATMSACTSGLFNCGMATEGTMCCPTGAACTSASSSGYYCLSSVPAALAATPTTTSATADPSGGNDNVALKVGLGVGIPGGIITIAVIVFAWRIRRAKKQRNHDSETDQKPEYRKPELAADSKVVPVELDTCVPELSAQILEAELPEEGIMAELPAGAPSQMPAQPPEPRCL